MRDFTLITYKRLLQALVASGYSFQTLQGFIRQPADKAVIVRHDIDRLPQNSLTIARLEKSMDVNSSYYFRAVPESFDEYIIKEIAELGHELGYHYENLSLCRGDYESAIKSFELDLKRFREIYPVKTICMHGSPLSKWDNRDLWKKYDYRDYGIIGEPYFDINFEKVLYLTDTGRRWDGDKMSVRDKIGAQGSRFKVQSCPRFRSTFDIIEAAEQGLLPDKMMLNTHPQRWTDNPLAWTRELVWQGVKNQAKRVLVGMRHS